MHTGGVLNTNVGPIGRQIIDQGRMPDRERGLGPAVRLPGVVETFHGWLQHVNELRAQGQSALDSALMRQMEVATEVQEIQRMLRALDSAEKSAHAALQDVGVVAGQVRG